MASRNTSGSEGTWNQGGNPGEGAGQAGSSPPALKQQAADLGRKATEGAREVASQVQSEARSRVERGKHEAATTLSSVASTLLQSGLQLRDDQQNMAGEYVERAARQIERAANYVQKADLREMVDEVEHFARRRPALFVGSAFAAGLLAARFLKSSRTTQQRSDEKQYMDREVPAPVAREPRGQMSEPETWQEPPL